MTGSEEVDWTGNRNEAVVVGSLRAGSSENGRRCESTGENRYDAIATTAFIATETAVEAVRE